MPKLLIGIPGYNGIVPEAQEAIVTLVGHTMRARPDLDVAISIVTKREQFRARNMLVDTAIGAGFDWLLMLDDDMVPPPDLVVRLLAHDKEVCGALYYQRGGRYHPVLLNRIVPEIGGLATTFLSHSDPRLTTPGLHQVDIVGGGCLLCKVDVFRKLMPPYFEPEVVLGTDINICSRWLDAGVQIWADTSLELGHVRSERQILTSRSIPLAERTLAQINTQLWEDALAYTTLSAEELRSAMVQASAPGQHRAHWEAAPTPAAYYQQSGAWHLYNLLTYNLHARETTKDWLLQALGTALPAPATLIDYGVGLGHMAIPLAQRGYTVVGVDVAGAATLEFVRWRMRRHGLGAQPDATPRLRLLEVAAAQPLPPAPAQGAYCISVLEHLDDPWGALRWLAASVVPGGLLVCPYACACSPDEPQHLRRYDPATFARDMRDLGWDESPDYPWLFVRRP